MHQLKSSNEIKTSPNIGDRIVAGIVDYIIIFGFFIFYVTTFGVENGEGEYSVNGLPAFVPVLFWGIMTVGFEQWFGATLGNLLVGLKPISIQESADNLNFSEINKLTFGQSLKRHLLDPIDMFFFGLIGIITIKNTDRNQRLGDIWANTIVIKTSDIK